MNLYSNYSMMKKKTTQLRCTGVEYIACFNTVYFYFNSHFAKFLATNQTRIISFYFFGLNENIYYIHRATEKLQQTLMLHQGDNNRKYYEFLKIDSMLIGRCSRLARFLQIRM